jgi:hypothetical protein
MSFDLDNTSPASAITFDVMRNCRYDYFNDRKLPGQENQTFC